MEYELTLFVYAWLPFDSATPLHLYALSLEMYDETRQKYDDTFQKSLNQRQSMMKLLVRTIINLKSLMRQLKILLQLY